MAMKRRFTSILDGVASLIDLFVEPEHVPQRAIGSAGAVPWVSVGEDLQRAGMDLHVAARRYEQRREQGPRQEASPPRQIRSAGPSANAVS
jgi:hypothetical protein